MRKCKKITAVIIILAMLLSCVGFPTFAAEKTPIIDHNFDDAVDIAAVKALGWNFTKNKSELGQEDGHGKYVALGISEKDEMNYKFVNAISDGKYEFNFDMKRGETSWPSVYVKNSKDGFQYLLRLSNDYKKMRAYSGNADNVICEIDGTKWYTVKYLIDMDAKKYSIRVYDATGNLMGSADDYDIYSDGGSDITALCIDNDGKYGTVSLDNVYFKEYEEPKKDLSFNHNFNDVADLDAVKTLGWSFTRNNSEVRQGEGHGNYVALGMTNLDAMQYGFSEAVAKGVYDFNFDMKLEATTWPQVYIKDSNNKLQFLMRLSNDYKNIKTYSGSQDSVVCAVNGTKWTTVKFVINVDTKKYSIKVYDETGALIGSADDNAISVSEIASLCIDNNGSYGGVLSVDNIYFAEHQEDTPDPDPEPDPQPGETTILDEPFENYASFDDMNANGWTTSTSENKIAHVLFNNHDNADNITGQYLVQECGSLARSFDNKSSGTYKITYWLKAGAKNNTNIYVSGDDKAGGKNSPMVLTAVYGDTLVTKSYREADGGIKLINIDRNEWYRVENIVNLDSGKITTSVYDKNGKLLKKNKLNELYSYTTGSTLTSINAFHMDNNYWPSDRDNFYFDDLKIESYVNKPALTMDDVTVTDYKDEVQSDLASVCPAVKIVELDFGANITADSASKITITPSANFTGAMNGEKYVMTFNQLLANNTSYTITVPADVANANGDTLGTSVTINLKTTTVSTDVRLASVTDDSGAPITTLAGLANKKVVVNTNAVNTGDDNAKLTYIMAFYKGNYLSHALLADNKTIDAGGFDAQPIEFTVGDMTDVTAVKVMLWNGLGTMVPWTDCIEINQ